MTCELYEEQISALIDHELKDHEQEMLFVHLSACGACRHSLQMVLNLRSNLAEEVPPLAPKELDEKILKKARFTHRVSVDRRAIPFHIWTGRISLPVPIAAVIMIALIAGSVALSSLWSKTQTVYITTLPVVEVHGYMP